MKEVIAMHGWNGDSNIWKIWINHFQEKGWLWKSGERGYGLLTPFIPKWSKSIAPKSNDQRVLIAHSLGPHLLKKDVLSEATDIVLISSFGRFIVEGPNNRALKTAIKGMQKSIGTSQEITMLNAFMEKAHQPLSINTINSGLIAQCPSLEGRKRLKSDLQLLIKTKGLPDGLSAKARVLVIEGQADAIVVPEAKSALIKDLKKHLKQQFTHWSLPSVGHAIQVPGLVESVQNWLRLYQ